MPQVGWSKHCKLSYLGTGGWKSKSDTYPLLLPSQASHLACRGPHSVNAHESFLYILPSFPSGDANFLLLQGYQSYYIWAHLTLTPLSSTITSLKSLIAIAVTFWSAGDDNIGIRILDGHSSATRICSLLTQSATRPKGNNTNCLKLTTWAGIDAEVPYQGLPLDTFSSSIQHWEQ